MILDYVNGLRCRLPSLARGALVHGWGETLRSERKVWAKQALARTFGGIIQVVARTPGCQEVTSISQSGAPWLVQVNSFISRTHFLHVFPLGDL